MPRSRVHSCLSLSRLCYQTVALASSVNIIPLMLIHCKLASNPANAHNTGRARKKKWKKRWTGGRKQYKPRNTMQNLKKKRQEKTIRPTVKCRWERRQAQQTNKLFWWRNDGSAGKAELRIEEASRGDLVWNCGAEKKGRNDGERRSYRHHA